MRESVDDGWGSNESFPASVVTSVQPEMAKSIISRNDSPDLGFDRTINPYRGCEHGCIYCYARPTHAYLNLSPGLDFETKLFFKPNAAKLLDAELSKPGYRVKWIQLGASTDPYQPIEGRLHVTRGVLEVLARRRHPVGITTKNYMVARDIDILAEMAKLGLVMVAMSVTTLEPKLARAMEPRASTPSRRLQAVRELSEAGVPVVVGAAPMIPGLNDHELESILEAAGIAGAKRAYYSTLRLPLEIKDLFKEWLASECPDRAARVMSLVRQMRDGKENDSTFGARMVGTGPIADLLAKRFEIARRRFHLDDRQEPLRCDLFRGSDQIEMF